VRRLGIEPGLVRFSPDSLKSSPQRTVITTRPTPPSFSDKFHLSQNIKPPSVGIGIPYSKGRSTSPRHTLSPHIHLLHSQVFTTVDCLPVPFHFSIYASSTSTSTSDRPHRRLLLQCRQVESSNQSQFKRRGYLRQERPRIHESRFPY
jgi:hypothetical protein